MRKMTMLLGALIMTSALLSAQLPAANDDQGAAGPPDQAGHAVARISVLNGDASVRHGDAGDWVAAAPDAWDTWNDQRDTYLTRPQSPQHVSPDVTGSEDLDNNGAWSRRRHEPSFHASYLRKVGRC